MLDEIVQKAHVQWTEWFGAPPGHLDALVRTGGPAHRHRVMLFLFAEGATRPRVVVKVGLSEREGRFVAREHDALQQVAPRLSDTLRETVPRALTCARTEQRTVAYFSAVDGRAPGDPVKARATPGLRRVLARFLDRALPWAEALAGQTTQEETLDGARLAEMVARFRNTYADRDRQRSALDSFARAVGATPLRQPLSWQHGDIGFGNVLYYRGQLRVLDWEHAQPDLEPWLDTVGIVGKIVSMRAGSAQGPSGLQRAVAATLSTSSWLGATIRERLEGAWRFPLPLGWGATLGWMREALLRDADGRSGHGRAGLALSLLTDPGTREHVAWLAPEW